MGVEEFLFESAARRPGATALIDPRGNIRYKELEKLSLRAASRLRSAGASEGDRILIAAKNSSSYCVLFLGALVAGCVPCPVHPGWPAERLRWIAASCEPSAVFGDDSGSGVFPDAVSVSGFVFGGAGVKWRRSAVRPPEPLSAIMHTSASSGEPKGVMLPRDAVKWVAEAISGVLGYGGEDVILCGLPFSFDYGLYQLFLALKSGAALVINPDFGQPLRIPALIECHRVTVFPLVPSLAAMLLRSHLLERAALPALRLVTSTGEVFPPSHVVRLREILKSAEILPMYGLTECKRVSITPPGTVPGKERSVGLALPGTRVKILNELGMEAGSGETGSLHVAGPHLMAGYWRDAEETSEKWYADAGGTRWLDTGDLMSRDAEGFLYFEGRRDGQLKIRGERVHPAEIEAIIAGIPGVAEAAVAVTGLKEERATLRAVVWIETHPDTGAGLDEEKILAECRKRLPPAWRPNAVGLAPGPLPRNPNGKLDRLAALTLLP